MLKVKRANVVLRINDTEKQHYLDKGYSILDENGKVVESAVPKNLTELEKAFIDHTNKIKELEATVKKLEAENAELVEKLEAKEEPILDEVKAESKKRGPKKKVSEEPVVE